MSPSNSHVSELGRGSSPSAVLGFSVCFAVWGGRGWFICFFGCTWASLIAQSVNHLTAVQETQVRFLGQEDRLQKEMATHSSILAWRIPWTEEPGGLQS